MHVFDAHWPYEPEPRWAERYYGDGDPRDPGLPDPGFELGQVKVELEGVRDPDWQRSLYRAEVSQLDAELERLLDHPRVRRAVTALTADHGESMGEQGVWYDHVGLDPGNLHIPLLLAGPGVPTGERTDRPVMHTDLARTLLDLAGLGEVPFPGTTLLEAAPPRPRYAMEGYGSSVSVTHDGLHCILNLEARQLPHVLETRAHHQVELYDLTADPRCERDLVDERPADAAKMRTALLRWLQAPPGGGWAEARQDDADFVASLAELGYVAPAGDASGDLWVPDDCAWCQRFED